MQTHLTDEQKQMIVNSCIESLNAFEYEPGSYSTKFSRFSQFTSKQIISILHQFPNSKAQIFALGLWHHEKLIQRLMEFPDKSFVVNILDNFYKINFNYCRDNSIDENNPNYMQRFFDLINIMPSDVRLTTCVNIVSDISYYGCVIPLDKISETDYIKLALLQCLSYDKGNSSILDQFIKNDDDSTNINVLTKIVVYAYDNQADYPHVFSRNFSEDVYGIFDYIESEQLVPCLLEIFEFDNTKALDIFRFLRDNTDVDDDEPDLFKSQVLTLLNNSTDSRAVQFLQSLTPEEETINENATQTPNWLASITQNANQRANEHNDNNGNDMQTLPHDDKSL